MELWRLLLPLLCLLAVALAETDNDSRANVTRKNGRRGKFFSIFQIVSFANDPCDAGSKNGTCYTAQECETRGGEENGSCAEGFGVCCTFEINCGETSSENSTYFESDSVTPGACVASICPSSNDICQLRLDFISFDIAGPVTDPVSASKALGGVFVPEGGSGSDPEVSLQTQCLTDTFQVVGSGGVTNSDIICGRNNGDHMYVEANDGGACTKLAFQLGQASTSVRQWSIKVTQYSCSYINLAPAGCTQYFFGDQNTGIVRTFNFDDGAGYHLANQDQSICVRREADTCRICWIVDASRPNDFQISGGDNNKAYNNGNVCCSYESDGEGVNGYDCLNIPGAEKSVATGTSPDKVGSYFCGRLALITDTKDAGVQVTSDNPKRICSRRTPFSISFRSDSYEFVNGNDHEGDLVADRGAQLTYTLDAINC